VVVIYTPRPRPRRGRSPAVSIARLPTAAAAAAAASVCCGIAGVEWMRGRRRHPDPSGVVSGGAGGGRDGRGRKESSCCCRRWRGAGGVVCVLRERGGRTPGRSGGGGGFDCLTACLPGALYPFLSGTGRDNRISRVGGGPRSRDILNLNSILFEQKTPLSRMARVPVGKPFATCVDPPLRLPLSLFLFLFF
jgi:hypothetical protein